MQDRCVAINQATTRGQWNLTQAVYGYARHGVRAIGVWREDLHACGVAATRELLKHHDMQVSSLSFGGLFTALDEQTRRDTFDDNRRAIDDARAIGARCLVVIAGGLPPSSKDIAGARRMVEDGLAELLPHAHAAGVMLALEPLHPMLASGRSCIVTLGEANDLCEKLGEGLGVVVDSFHQWWDPTLEQEISRASARILAVQVSDWLPLSSAQERGMIGDGVIDVGNICRCVSEAGYRGPYEVEIISASDWWQRDPDEVVATAMQRIACV
jgi:sugar phosphate isomerase/epimerase